MKKLIVAFLSILSFGTSAQDTIVFKSGKVLPTHILQIQNNSGTGLIIHTNSIDTTYSSLVKIESYKLHSQLNETNKSDGLQMDIPADPYAFTKIKDRPFKFSYGKLSVGTNVLALVPVFPTNTRITIEPEYQILEKFSIKMPIMIGVKQIVNLGNQQNISPNFGRDLYSYGLHEWAEYYLYPNIAVKNMYSRKDHNDVIFKLGINPKYYPFGKSNKPLSFYIGASLNFGIMDSHQWDYYQTMDTAIFDPGGLYEITHWDISVERIEISKNEFFFYNYEAQFGLEYNFSKRLNLGVEALYASRTFGKAKLDDRIFAKKFDEPDYTLALEEEANFGWGYIPIRFRMFITYRFGGKLKE